MYSFLHYLDYVICDIKPTFSKFNFLNVKTIVQSVSTIVQSVSLQNYSTKCFFTVLCYSDAVIIQFIKN